MALPQGDVVIYVKPTPVLKRLLGHVSATHIPVRDTNAIEQNYRYRNLKMQLTVSTQFFTNLHHPKKKDWEKSIATA